MSLAKYIRDFFAESHAYSWPNANIVIFRQDGMILYAQNGSTVLTNKEKLEFASVGALMGGLWQSAMALATSLPKHKATNEIFRLSFDTSSKGLYILPFSIHNKEYYLGMMYANEVNPAQIKSKLRMMIEHLATYVTEKNAAGPKVTAEVEKQNRLFEDITDEEMDRLFSFVGN